METRLPGNAGREARAIPRLDITNTSDVRAFR